MLPRRPCVRSTKRSASWQSDMLEFIGDLLLDLFQEYCFHLIKKHVENRFLRGVLYVLTVVLTVVLAFAVVAGVIALILTLIGEGLDAMESLLT